MLLQKWFAAVAALMLPAVLPALDQSFTYQGRLTQSGTPYNGTCNTIRFSLYDAPVGGTHIADQTASSVEIQDGLFSADLDFGDAWRDGERYLEITLMCGDTPVTLAPRKRITAVPYAARAASAGSADYARTAGSATSSSFARTALDAREADRANTATYATSAGSAVNADYAATADHANTADDATNAVSAQLAVSANHAQHADEATSASFAAVAATVLNGGSSAHADHADTADEAVFADTAMTAVNALKLGGIDASNFLTTGPSTEAVGTMTYQVTGCPGAGCVTASIPVTSFEWTMKRPGTITPSGITAGAAEFSDLTVTTLAHEHVPQMLQQVALGVAQNFVFHFEAADGGDFTITVEGGFLAEVTEQAPAPSPEGRVKMVIALPKIEIKHSGDARQVSWNIQNNNGYFLIMPQSLNFLMVEDVSLQVTPDPGELELKSFSGGVRNTVTITSGSAGAGIAAPAPLEMRRSSDVDTLNVFSSMIGGSGFETMVLKRLDVPTPSRPSLYAQTTMEDAYVQSVTLSASAATGGLLEESFEVIASDHTWQYFTTNGTQTRTWNFATNSQ